jgi:HK97 family phage portal protein
MIRRLLGNRSESRSLSFQDIWGRGLDMTSARTASGEVVTYDSALTLSAVYAAIRLLSDNVSTLNLDVLYRSQGSEQKFRPIPTWMGQMNPELRNHEVLGQIVTSLLLDGNAYISTLRDRTGRVVSISVLDPKTVTPRMKTDEDGLSRITFQSDQAQGVEFTSRDIVMVRNLLKPGQIEGVSPITAAREFIGLGLAVNKYGAAFFGNGALPGAVIEVPGTLSEVGAQQLKSSWESVHKGAANGSRLAVLTEGSKFSRQLSLSPEDSQFLQTKQATVQDVCRLYGVPPHLLADSSGSTSWGSGLAEQTAAFATYSLRPLVTRVESALTSILRSEGIAVAYCRFDLESMRRATNDRWDTYSTAIQTGVLSIDEVRSYENLPALPDGKGSEHYVPLNLAPVGQEPSTDEV